MAFIFRTTDALKWGAGKGARLLKEEIDNNLWEVILRLVALETTPIVPTQISSVTLTGTQLTFHMDNGATFGPFTIPIAVMKFRGDWAPFTVYDQVDLFRVTGDGLYMVLRDHTSFSSFDPNETTVDGPLYSLILTASAVAPTDFLSLTDTPPNYTGHAGKAVVVNATGDGLDYTDLPVQDDTSAFRDNARVASIANLDLATGGLLTIDDIVTVEDDRVLVKDQLTKSENGIYLAKPGAWVRSLDAENVTELQGAIVFVDEGTAQGGTLWALTSGTSSEIQFSELITTVPASIIRSLPTAAYTLKKSDLGKWIWARSSNPMTYTLPDMLADSWPRNGEIILQRGSTSTLTLTPAAGVTINNSNASIVFPARYDTIRLKVRGHNNWIMEVQIGGGGGSVAWDDVTGKPATFPPDAHTHPISDVTGLQAALDDKQFVAQTISYTGNRTLLLTDAENYLRCTDAAASALTVPPNATVAFPVDTVVHHRTAGAGKVTLTAGAGVTLNPPFGQTLVTAGAGATVSMKQVDIDVWDVIGLTELV